MHNFRNVPCVIGDLEDEVIFDIAFFSSKLNKDFRRKKLMVMNLPQLILIDLTVKIIPL